MTIVGFLSVGRERHTLLRKFIVIISVFFCPVIFFCPHFCCQFILLNEYLFSPWFIQVFSMLSQSIHLYPFIICIVVQLFCILWPNFVYLCWQEKGSTKGEGYVNKEKNNRFVRIHTLQSIKTWHSFQTRC